jgi:hypothetical protein
VPFLTGMIVRPVPSEASFSINSSMRPTSKAAEV